MEFRKRYRHRQKYKTNRHAHLWSITCAILFGLLCLFSSGCSERPRNNPLDPQNPETGGKPVCLHVFSIEDTVTLSWQSMNSKALKGFRVFRSIAGVEGDSLVAEVNQNRNFFEDNSVRFNRKYCYQISAVTADYESPRSPKVCITPGPTYTWVIKGSPSALTRLTHDCGYAIFSTELDGYPERMVVNSQDETIWIFDDFLNRIYHLDAHGNYLCVRYDYNQVSDMEVSIFDSGLWLIRHKEKQLIKLDVAGVETSIIRNFIFPKCLAVEPKNGSCWLGDWGARRLSCYSNAGVLQQQIKYDFHSLKSLALYGQNSEMWIADSTRLLKINLNRTEEFNEINHTSFQNVYLLDIDQNTGACWACDNQAIYKFSATGELEFRLENFQSVISLAVNYFDGSCLVVDGYRSRLFHISSDGQNMEQINTVQYPALVAVQY